MPSCSSATCRSTVSDPPPRCRRPGRDEVAVTSPAGLLAAYDEQLRTDTETASALAVTRHEPLPYRWRR